MGRALRVQYPGAWYHVMNRGAGRQNIFRNNNQREKFLELIEEIFVIYDIETHAYCLMSNHYHLLLRTPLGNLSDGMRHLNSNYTKIFNKSEGRDGPLFRGRYKSIIVEGDDYLLTLSRYIHLNPFEAGLIQNLPQYTWSSYPAYIGEISQPQWLFTDEIKARFTKVCKEKKTYSDYVENHDKEELRNLIDKSLLEPIFGDDKFREFIAKIISGEIDYYEQPDVKKIFNLPNLTLIIKEVARYFNVDEPSIRALGKNVTNKARDVAILLSREVGKFRLQEIAEFFNFNSYKSVSNSLTRCKKSSEIKKHVARIKKQLGSDVARET